MAKWLKRQITAISTPNESFRPKISGQHCKSSNRKLMKCSNYLRSQTIDEFFHRTLLRRICKFQSRHNFPLPMNGTKSLIRNEINWHLNNKSQNFVALNWSINLLNLLWIFFMVDVSSHKLFSVSMERRFAWHKRVESLFSIKKRWMKLEIQ